MYRQTVRPLKQLRCSVPSNVAPPRRRFLSTAPPHQRPRSWKSSAARWAVAIGGVYFYNTSPVFAEQPSALPYANSDEESEEQHPSIDTVRTAKGSSVLASASDAPSSPPSEHHTPSTPNAAANPTELEEEAHSEGAFNPITGEINWDCPCLGGMAYGPCGEQFRTAFSCFVYSTEEPKGMDCIDQFQGMQECFKAHPDVYPAELEDDVGDEEMDEAVREERRKLEEEVRERRKALEEGQGQQKRTLDDTPVQAPSKPQPQLKNSTPPPSQPPSPSPPQEQPPSQQQSSSSPSPESSTSPPPPTNDARHAAKSAKESVQQNTSKEVFDEDLELMPKEWHDSRDSKPEHQKGRKTEK